MKKITSAGFIALTLCFGFACDGTKEDSVEQAQETNEQKFEDTAREERKDDQSEFMTKAASGGMMEVELGKMAQEKAQTQEVKDFGAMMVKDHSAANEELKQLAAQKNITLPDSMSEGHMDHVKELREKTGMDFDKAYMSLMVEDHQEDVEMFEEAANNMQDADVKAFASKTVTTLRQHLDKAKQVKEKVDNMKDNATTKK
ncbi:MAG: DUF4142 domain-containing protein [Hymenobacteraceae bacterium]|nr:DUF4142 domain-containing protein [Hymenobacteraceae bacterium]MDX5397045.1 DUF4142 domain-containing protein [Hymenobacteraceae bacterium]MDX5513113.1 DUF4142 domain-containing protein [Hymenobacteraceae bacterium]